MAQQILSAPIEKDEAYALADAAMDRDGLALTASAHEDGASGLWIFAATCEDEADMQSFVALAEDSLGRAIAFSAAPIDLDFDWVTHSLQGLRPVRAGGFYIHGSHEISPPPAGTVPILIDAAQAFGTGHHETTTGCLEAIAKVLKRGPVRRPVDLGTGTGVLAIAIAKRTRVPVLATDIDPVAVATTRANAAINGVSRWIRPLEAAGLAHTAITSQAPYDLVVANILAGPLVGLAPGIGRIAGRGAHIVLSGLLTRQAPRVIAAYGLQGMALRERIIRKEWCTLLLQRP